jgi:hypothetical protein
VLVPQLKKRGEYKMTNKEVYIKFGQYHGKKAIVLGETTKDGYPAFKLKVKVNDFTTDIITKKQKNTVRMIGDTK